MATLFRMSLIVAAQAGILGIAADANAQWQWAQGKIYTVADKVGIGTSSPAHRLHVLWNGARAIYARNTGPGVAYGGFFEATSTSGRAVAGVATSVTGSPIGVLGKVSSNGDNSAGVHGWATATTGMVFGVRGVTNSDGEDSAGVSGLSTVVGGNGSYGVSGETRSPNGTGVYGVATSAADGNSRGVVGESFAGEGGIGVLGRAWGECGVAGEAIDSGTGVVGRAIGDGEGVGVSGINERPGGIGVYGQSLLGGDAGEGLGVLGIGKTAGVRGTSINNNAVAKGVWGYSQDGYGVFGECPNEGYAVWAQGKSGASGTKSFRIDHPSDPLHKYLFHYCAEGPEPQNVYNGIVSLDGSGSAWVVLPNYFGAINRDPRYVLTAVGAPGPMLYIATEIDLTGPTFGFGIAGGTPGGRVSWEVKAVRNDAWVRTHGAPVEASKPPGEDGRLQHSELYPAGEGITKPQR